MQDYKGTDAKEATPTGQRSLSKWGDTVITSLSGGVGITAAWTVNPAQLGSVAITDNLS